MATQGTIPPVWVPPQPVLHVLTGGAWGLTRPATDSPPESGKGGVAAEQEAEAGEIEVNQAMAKGGHGSRRQRPPRGGSRAVPPSQPQEGQRKSQESGQGRQAGFHCGLQVRVVYRPGVLAGVLVLEVQPFPSPVAQSPVVGDPQGAPVVVKAQEGVLCLPGHVQEPPGMGRQHPFQGHDQTAQTRGPPRGHSSCPQDADHGQPLPYPAGEQDPNRQGCAAKNGRRLPGQAPLQCTGVTCAAEIVKFLLV